MNRLWQRINTLVPNPKCRTRGNKLLSWDDERPQPTEAELLAVDVDAIESAEEARQEEIKTELADNILNNKTFGDVDVYIDNLFSSATTVAAVKTAIISVLKIYGKLILAIAKRQNLSD